MGGITELVARDEELGAEPPLMADVGTAGEPRDTMAEARRELLLEELGEEEDGR